MQGLKTLLLLNNCINLNIIFLLKFKLEISVLELRSKIVVVKADEKQQQIVTRMKAEPSY